MSSTLAKIAEIEAEVMGARTLRPSVPLRQRLSCLNFPQPPQDRARVPRLPSSRARVLHLCNLVSAPFQRSAPV